MHAYALRLCLEQRIDGARVVHVRPIAQDLNSDIHLTLLSDIPLEVYPSSFFEAVCVSHVCVLRAIKRGAPVRRTGRVASYWWAASC